MKKSSKKTKPEHAGIMRNDLPGFFRVVGKKIYVRYKGKDIATGCDNTPAGWKLANIFWEKRSKELIAIQLGEKMLEDTILNIFHKFLDYKRKIAKITQKTETFYITGFKAIFVEPNEILSESNIKKQINNFMETTTVSTSSINIYLRAVAGFLNWASDEDNNYIPKKNYIKKYKQKENQKIKPPYTENEYNLLLAYFQNVTQNLEMCLLLQFLWHTGSRVGETLNIKLTDLDLLNNRIIVPNKIYKGKQELLLLTPEAVKIVEEAKEFAILRGDKKLFSWKETRLPNRIVERAERNIGIKKEGRGLHGFRRAFTRKLVKNKITIPDMQDILRHKSIGITMKHYNEYRPEELVEEMSKKL